MKKWFLACFAFLYRSLVRRVLFLIPSETIHEILTTAGETMGKLPLVPELMKRFFAVSDDSLMQTFFGIRFDNPIGLSAGFDYKAQLTGILPSLGFGFGSIGTITNHAYEGNPPPRLGRLPKSKALMVNKGFKNDGVKAIVRKMKRAKFVYPVGISIGRTNSKNLTSVRKSIVDTIQAFMAVDKSPVPFSYYELNISCPNLVTNVSFYDPKNLSMLLQAVKKLRLTKPLFVKMPINETDTDVIRMLNVIVRFPVKGVIFGNLQKNRKDPSLDLEEVKKYSVGNFSGKPTWQRSNELITLAYKKYGKKLLIIGCGGVFSAQDAYEKIKRGASLIQLITGLIYEGPLLPAHINLGLVELLHKDGYHSISEAIGKNGS